MSEANFTPGPWTAGVGDRLSDAGHCWVIDSEEGSIAEMMCPREVEEANARLIAAAPDLYAAAEAALKYDVRIQSHAFKGKNYAEDDTLDDLHADWINKSRTALAAVEEKPRT